MPLLYPNSAFVGNAHVRGRLYDVGGYPAIVLDDDDGPVAGEVFEIDDETMRALDKFEATADYRRTRVTIELNELETTCWVYRPDAELCAEKEQIASGDWIEYVGVTNA